MLVIDDINTNPGPFLQNRETQKTLLSCALVCRAWLRCAQKHLYTSIAVRMPDLNSLNKTLKSTYRLSSHVNKLEILNDYSRELMSSFVISHQLFNLVTLTIESLNLTQEHPLIYRATLFHSIQHLCLIELPDCQLSQLVRFINSFSSLVSFKVFTRVLKHRGQILPKPIFRPKPLVRLDLSLIPGITGLILWFLKDGVFLNCLKTLVLRCYIKDSKDRFRLCFEGVDALLSRCRDELDDLTLSFSRIPLVNDVSYLCMPSIF